MALLFRREVISLGQIQDPRREFVVAANTGKPGRLPPSQEPTTGQEEGALA
jgi:NADH dehydrogenase